LRYTFPRTRNEDELRLRAILILAIIAISASAQTPELRVSLRELTGEAIKNSPDIAAAQKRYEAARQRPTQESTLPDPMISL
jgi:outer membrane protein TolC